MKNNNIIKKVLFFGILLTFLSVNFIPSVVSTEYEGRKGIGTFSTTWTVDNEGDGDFMNIQEAINSPSVLDGDIIEVYSGTYTENVVIDKELILEGKDVELGGGSDTGKPIIDAQGSGNAVRINANNVVIMSFIIQGGGDFPYAGIYIDDFNSVTVINNTISDNIFNGIYLRDTSDNLVTQNTFENNDQYGIYLWQTANNNMFYHNNFISNWEHAYDKGSNTWNDEYPSGGNYWDDYDEASEGAIDEYSGPNQDQPGSDGIVDSPYDIPGDSNQDRYPYMNPNGWNYQPPELEIANITGGWGGLLKGGKVCAEIKNTGEITASGIKWNISVQGGILDFVNVTDGGTIEMLEPGNVTTVCTVTPLYGLGPIEITVSVSMEGIDSVIKTVDGFIFIVFVIVQ